MNTGYCDESGRLEFPIYRANGAGNPPTQYGVPNDGSPSSYDAGKALGTGRRLASQAFLRSFFLKKFMDR